MKHVFVIMLIGLLFRAALAESQPKDLNQKIQDLLISKKRTEAIRVLSTMNSSEAKKLLSETLRIFLTERGQTLYASAQSQPEAKAKEALELLLEAQALEDGNLDIYILQTRMLLALKECDSAQKTLDEAKNIWTFSPELRLLRVQMLECQQKYSEADLALQSAGDFSGLEWLAKTLQARAALRSPKKNEFKFSESELNKIASPERYYLKFKAPERKGIEAKEAAMKYVQLCRAGAEKDKKRFALDVSLCQGLDEVEEHLKQAADATSSTGSSSK